MIRVWDSYLALINPLRYLMLRKILRFGPVVDATRWGIKIRFEIQFGRLKILRCDVNFAKFVDEIFPEINDGK